MKGGPPPLISRGPDIHVRVCTFEDACAAAVRQTEIVSIRDARSSFSEFAVQWVSDSPSRILRSLNLSQNQANSAIFQIAADFTQILRLDTSCDVIAMRIQSKKGCFSVPKMEWTALRSLHARFTRANVTSDKRTKSGTNPRYSFGLYGADRLSARAIAAGCSRTCDTVIHSAGRYS